MARSFIGVVMTADVEEIDMQRVGEAEKLAKEANDLWLSVKGVVEHMQKANDELLRKKRPSPDDNPDHHPDASGSKAVRKH